jgi:iron complex transport system substrate-binding protein
VAIDQSKPFAACLVAALSVAMAAPARGETTAMEVVDHLGREVTVRVPARRVVLLEGYELLPTLGTWGQVAGLSRYAFDNDLLAAARPNLRQEVADAGTAMAVNAESLLRLRPDLVLTWTVDPDAVRFLAARGLTVVSIYPESLAQLYETTRLIGRVFGAEPRAEAALARMEEIFQLIRRHVAGIPPAQRKKALWLLGKPTTVGGGTGVTQDVFALAGLVNGAAGARQRTVEASPELLLTWRPDVIFIWGSAGYGRKELVESQQWRFVPAVRSRQVFKAPKWSTWSPRLAPVALWMAARAYPERFADVDVDRVIDRFYRDVYGLSYAQARHIED